MTYPVIVAIVAVAAVTILMVFVVPIFANMFAEGGAKLPLPTRIVIGISDFIRHWILAILMGVGGGLFSLFRYYKTDKGHLKLDQILLQTPVIGDLERKSCISRFTRTLGTLLNSGVSIIDALQVTAKTSGNKVLELGIYRTLENISGGKTIAVAESHRISAHGHQMIAVGERTEWIVRYAHQVARILRRQVDAAVDALTSARSDARYRGPGIIIRAVKTGLVSTVSHELKTPLTSVRMALHLLLEEQIGSLNSKQTELLLAARDDSERLLTMINDLLDLARLESGATRMMTEQKSARELIADAIEQNKDVAERHGVTLVSRIASDELPPVAVESQQIGHVFSNLINNAARHSPRGEGRDCSGA